MARKQIEITITDENRDKGKSYRITEMPHAKAQEFTDRVFFAAMNCGAKIPGKLGQIGMAELWLAGLSVIDKIPYEWARPLLEMLMDCVDIPTDVGVYRKRVESDIEEVQTVFRLREETLKLHFGFFAAGGGSTSDQPPQEPKTTA